MGTSRLTLVGYTVIIDATALTGSFSIGGTGSFSTTVPHTITTLPGIKMFDHDVDFNFEVQEVDGKLFYEEPPDVMLFGLGTNTLVVQPIEGT